MLTRHSANPVLAACDVPYLASTVFNAGVVKFEGRYVMMFRNDYSRTHTFPFEGCNLGLATSRDGVRWTVEAKPVLTLEDGWRLVRGNYDPRFGPETVTRVYDPRLTVIDGEIFLCFACDTQQGIRGGIARTRDFARWELVTLTLPDNRNMVLFPEKIGGHYVRLERPFPVYMRAQDESFDLWASRSPDLAFWGDTRLVLAAREVPYANAKIGPAAPPIRTSRGWLTTFHAVQKHPEKRNRGWEEKGWFKTYYAGLMLLALDDPTRVIGLMREPLLAPAAAYEIDGFRGSVIFPCGTILENSGEVKLYYGAADTCVALATGHLDDLVAACKPL